MTVQEVSKKRPRPIDKDEELEIDISADVPLSKRAARRLKKGRSLKQAPSSQKPLPSEFDDASDDSSSNDEEKATKPKVERVKKSKADGATETETETRRKKIKKASTDEPEEPKKGTNGIWIGNLSFRTTETDLTTFFSTLKPLGKSLSPNAYAPITAADVVRISLPQGEKKGQNKGFAYVDFKTAEQQITAIALSERILAGRNVLIKAADSFDGRPKPSAASVDEKATKILYIGNLSFDITSEDLERYLGGQDAGIRKVRMATFEDSGKCKGFAFVDFNSPEQVKKILLDKKMANMNGRKLKMEYGQDRSLRRPGGGARVVDPAEVKVDPRSVPPGRALMSAQRASHAIVEAKGTKQTFE